MCKVYLAEDTKLRRKVALKLLSADLTKNADRLRRFDQEAQAASALNHPNIITVYDIGESEAGRFIVMDWSPAARCAPSSQKTILVHGARPAILRFPTSPHA